MPVGAFWRLEYEDDPDHRIEARADRQRFAQDRNVLTAFTRYYEGSFLLEVQLVDDAETTFDEGLHQLYNRRAYQQRSFERQHLGNFWQPPEQPFPQRGGPMDQETRDRIISQYISTPTGRGRLAQAMIAPLRRSMNYSSMARRAFLVEALPEGALPIYDDFDPPAWLKQGTWVKSGEDYAIVVATEPKGDGPTVKAAMVEYQVWRDAGLPKRTDARTFCKDWLPSEIPQEPRTRFERILMDDD